jgi:presenilin-like A22 family membrane protease
MYASLIFFCFHISPILQLPKCMQYLFCCLEFFYFLITKSQWWVIQCTQLLYFSCSGRYLFFFNRDQTQLFWSTQETSVQVEMHQILSHIAKLHSYRQLDLPYIYSMVNQSSYSWVSQIICCPKSRSFHSAHFNDKILRSFVIQSKHFSLTSIIQCWKMKIIYRPDEQG